VGGGFFGRDAARPIPAQGGIGLTHKLRDPRPRGNGPWAEKTWHVQTALPRPLAGPTSPHQPTYLLLIFFRKTENPEKTGSRACFLSDRATEIKAKYADGTVPRTNSMWPAGTLRFSTPSSRGPHAWGTEEAGKVPWRVPPVGPTVRGTADRFRLFSSTADGLFPLSPAERLPGTFPVCGGPGLHAGKGSIPQPPHGDD